MSTETGKSALNVVLMLLVGFAFVGVGCAMLGAPVCTILAVFAIVLGALFVFAALA